MQKRERLALSLWLKKLAKSRNCSKDRHPGTKDVKEILSFLMLKSTPRTLQGDADLLPPNKTLPKKPA